MIRKSDRRFWKAESVNENDAKKNCTFPKMELKTAEMVECNTVKDVGESSHTCEIQFNKSSTERKKCLNFLNDFILSLWLQCSEKRTLRIFDKDITS